MKKAFTLAEVLITLAIIGVVAAISIPSVISNAQQQEFKTGLRKAVSVLNGAITMNIALDDESPYDNHDLFRYLQRHMSVMKSTSFGYVVEMLNSATGEHYDSAANASFYTTDGMSFNFHTTTGFKLGNFKLHESNTLACVPGINPGTYSAICPACGSLGLANNPNNTTLPPCLIMVDVNGDRKPNPKMPECYANKSSDCRTKNSISYPSPNSKKVTDVFGILITESKAIPYGVVAQKAMYNSQK